jgi:imidazolonepropionase
MAPSRAGLGIVERGAVAARDGRILFAVATDCNPGTSPMTWLLLALNMAAILFGTTIEECLLSVTRIAAYALGLAQEIGTLEARKRADMALWNVDRPAELVYRLGLDPLHARIWSGA